jgi:hypothetical protein
MARYPLLSPEWIDAVRLVVENLVAQEDLTGIEYTISQEVSDPPPDRAAPLGWSLSFHDGRVEVGYEPLAVADFRLVTDYQVHHDLTTRVWGGDAEVMAASREAWALATAAGKLRTEGQMADAPTPVRDLLLRLHDPLAELTE